MTDSAKFHRFSTNLILLSVLFEVTLAAVPLTTLNRDKEVEDAKFWQRKGKDAILKRLSIDPRSTYTGAKNVIVFLGDGMGIAPTVGARIYKGQKEGSPYGGEEAELVWETFPYAAFSKTYNTDYQVPDSAGTATAVFSGVKTRMAVLGIDSTPQYNQCDPDVVERSKLKTMLHKAIEDNKATGIVTTARITHATPGALYSHIQNRDWEADSLIPEQFRNRGCEDIAKQLVYNDVAMKTNVLFGGGLKNFLLERDGGKRLDRDLVQAWREQKILNGQSGQVFYNARDLKNWGNADYVLGLFADAHMSYNVDRDTSDAGEPSLSEMTRAALERLKLNPNGFFLMVEGGLIDVAHHKNNAKRAFEETLEFERAIKVALEMVNVRETLIIVTADHSHAMTINGYPKRGNPILGSIFEVEKKNFMIQPDGYMSPYTTISYANGPGFLKHFTGNDRRPWKDVSKDFEKPIEDDIDFMQPSLWRGPEDYETHGGEDVGIFAIGPMSHLFIGVQEQSYISHVVDHATELWKKSGFRSIAGATSITPLSFLTLMITTFIAANWL